MTIPGFISLTILSIVNQNNVIENHNFKILPYLESIYVTTGLVQYIAYCGISKDAKKVHVH